MGRAVDHGGTRTDRQGDAPRQPRPLSDSGGARCHARPRTPREDTDWAQIDHLYAVLERMQPSPVVTLNRAVAVAKLNGPEAALALLDPLEDKLSGYFYYFGARGMFLMQLGRRTEARTASIARSHSPTRRPKPRISAGIWIGWRRKSADILSARHARA